ncbi:MAG: MFS transporter [Proteobacteria bacterium]|nr:MFS transporter [Pseudomonadota bacterium]
MTAIRHTFSHIRNMPGAFWVVIVVAFINQLGNMAMMFLVAYLTVHFKFSLPAASLIYALLCGAMLISGTIAGATADHFGAAKVMAIVLCTNAVVLLCMPLFNHFWSIALMCILWGIVIGAYRPAAQTFLMHVAPAESYRVAFSIFRLCWNLGMSIGPAIGGYLATHSFQLIFIFNGVANIVAGIILVLGLLFKPGVDQQPPPSTSEHKRWGWSYLWHDKLLLIFVLGMIPVTMVFYQNGSTMPVFIHQNLGLQLTIYGLLFTLNTLMIVFFELPISIITLTWPAKRSLIIGSILMATGFGGFYFSSSAWHLFLLTAIWSLGEIIFFPTASSYVAELAPPARRGSYVSIYSTSINTGLLVGPWAGAIIMHAFTGRGLWLACWLWGLVSSVIFIYLGSPKRDTFD